MWWALGVAGRLAVHGGDSVGEDLERAGIILAGLLLLLHGAARATNYRGALDRLTARVTAEEEASSALAYARTRPIIFRLYSVIEALWGLAIVSAGVLWWNVQTLVGGVWFGSLLALSVLTTLTIVVQEGRFRWQREQELKARRSR